jgi:hypothetical protein
MIALNIETLQVMEPKKKRKNNPIYYVPLVIFEINKIIVLCIIYKPCGPFYYVCFKKYIYEGWFVNIKLINFLNVFVLFLVKKMNITFLKYSQQKKSFHIMQHE